LNQAKFFATFIDLYSVGDSVLLRICIELLVSLIKDYTAHAEAHGALINPSRLPLGQF